MKKIFVLSIAAVLIPLLLCGFIYHFSTTAAALSEHRNDLEREEVSLTCRKEAAVKSLQDYARFEEAMRIFISEKGNEIAFLTERSNSLEEKIGDVNAIKNEVNGLRSELKEVRETFLNAFSRYLPADSAPDRTEK